MLQVKKTTVHRSWFSVPYFAFTLAEVLITLGIIGVVAAITIPAVIQRSQEQNSVVQLKKTYNTLSNAYNRAVADNGSPRSWGLTSSTHYDPAIAEKMMGYLTPYLQVAKDCGISLSNTGCFPNGTYKYRDNSGVWINWTNINTNSDGQFARIRLADGSGLAVVYLEAGVNCDRIVGPTAALQSVCGALYVDIDGQKGQSLVGVDLFGFYLTNYGIVPMGVALATNNTFSANCVSSGGWGCTAWVIYNENMDYMKPCGSTLSWSGPKSCN